MNLSTVCGSLNVIKLINSSACEFTNQGKIDGAERLCWRALRILRKSNMGYHVQTGAVLVALAGLLRKQVIPPLYPKNETSEKIHTPYFFVERAGECTYRTPHRFCD